MDIKYTSDGRKVVIVGKLNAEQHIVQEVFVTGGQEVPSGENFVVSSLHDAPAESWKEKRLRELEEKYDKEKSNIEGRIKQMRKNLSAAEAKAKYKASALMAFAQNSDDGQMDTLRAFMAGEVTHFFIDGYSPEIVSADSDRLYDTDSWGGRYQIEGMKLISLFGTSGGKLDYRLHDYRDGSGGSKRIVPFTSYEDALAEAQSILNLRAAEYVAGERKSFEPNKWSDINGIQIPTDALKKHNEEKRKQQITKIKKLRQEAANLERLMRSGE